MILKAFKSISVGVLIQLGMGLAVQGLAQAYCTVPGSYGCEAQRELELHHLREEAERHQLRLNNRHGCVNEECS